MPSSAARSFALLLQRHLHQTGGAALLAGAGVVHQRQQPSAATAYGRQQRAVDTGRGDGPAVPRRSPGQRRRPHQNSGPLPGAAGFSGEGLQRLRQ